MKNNIPFFQYLWGYRKGFLLFFQSVCIYLLFRSIQDGYTSGYIAAAVLECIFWGSEIFYDHPNFREVVDKSGLKPQHQKYAF